MAFAKVHSAQTNVLSGDLVDIEVDLSRGLHSFSVVGLPDKATEEAKDRIAQLLKILVSRHQNNETKKW